MVRFLDGLLKMTYDLWQLSLSGLNMAQCYGTGYVVRRAAIDSVGGWSKSLPLQRCGAQLFTQFVPSVAHGKAYVSLLVLVMHLP